MALSKCNCTRTPSKHTSNHFQQVSPLQRPLVHRSYQDHQRIPRLRAVPVAGEVADLATVAEALGVLGIAAGGLFGALWNLEKQNGSKLQQELQGVQQQVLELQQQLEQAQQKVEQEQQARKEAEEWKPRLDAAQTELFKLERALELKDGQLAVFMSTAHRQIKGLEESVKELQKI